MEAARRAPPHDGYVDLQVNGFAGADFNGDRLTSEQMHQACLSLRADGAAGFLATIVSAELGAMKRRLARIVALCRADSLAREMFLGIHIEGPFISSAPGYIGAHSPAAVRPASLDQLKELLEATDGSTRIVTLAPENDSDQQLTRYLADQGITVAAGHCNPSLDQLRAGIDAGLSMFTHLGNACAAVVPKHDNIIQRTLSLAGQLRISFIADGVHVPFTALGNYLRSASLDRCVIVSDTISAAGLGPGRYAVGDSVVQVGEDQVPRAEIGNRLAGSATSLAQMIDNLRRHLQLSEPAIQQLTVHGPRAILQGQ